MDLVLVNKQHESCLSSLGTQIGDSYRASENCLEVLKEIHQTLLTENKVTRSFRRSIHFSQGLQNDIVPLLISTKDREVVSAIVRILACLLVPVECLLPLDIMSQNEVGQIVVFELKSFLAKSKTSFGDLRSTQAILEFMKSHIKLAEEEKLVNSECEAINNCLLVLRNVLHIPEIGHIHKNLQNIIVWNLFVQNIDQILLHLMTNENKAYWSVAIVQLIAVLYKDQHVGTLQKLLHVWFEGSFSESSEDNESNTSPQDQRSISSLHLMSSELNSDSSEASGKNRGNLESSSGVPHVSTRSPQAGTHECANPCCKSKFNQIVPEVIAFEEPAAGRKSPNGVVNRRCHSGTADDIKWRTWDAVSNTSSGHGSSSNKTCSSLRPGQRTKPTIIDLSENVEFSDYGYASHVESSEVVSTSSNEEESPPKKRPFHQKPQKTRYCHKQRSHQEKKEVRRKKLMKRSKNTLMNIKALANHIPRDEDITHALKEFTVGFLLNGYEPLVTALLTELLTPSSGLPIDTSHFFWLLTYFLKFAGQLELDIEQVRGVLSFSVLSYLVYEGVSISEQVEQTVNVDADGKASLRRQHLVVTAIREFILSLEAYDKVNYLSLQDKEEVRKLQNLLRSSTDLKCLFVLMIRLYRPDVHSRQYLEDLIVTNHILLTFLEQKNEDSSKQLPGEKTTPPITDHLKLFASVDVMKHYGLLLEDFQSNGEFINDCIFTMMHHIGGEMNYVATLCQPNILKTFTQIWESDFELCEDWSDLIEFVIHRFVNLPRSFFDSSSVLPLGSQIEDASWSKEECQNLNWYFALSSPGSDPIANIIKLYKENGVTKTRISIIERLLTQGMISSDQHKQLLNEERQYNTLPGTPNTVEEISIDSEMPDEITSLRDTLLIDGLTEQLSWLQRLLLDTRHAKLVLQQSPTIQLNHHCEPVAYYFSMLNLSIPVVAWGCDLAAALRNSTFHCLLRQLGFHLPSETGKLFFRIPSFWTPDVLLSVAQKFGPVDPSLLRNADLEVEATALKKEENLDDNASCQQFAVPRAKNSVSIVNYTPLPNLATCWLDVVNKSKSSTVLELSELAVVGAVDEDLGRVKESPEMEDLECASVVSVCDTQASDLTRMCISDEDEDGNPLPDWC